MHGTHGVGTVSTGAACRPLVRRAGPQRDGHERNPAKLAGKPDGGDRSERASQTHHQKTTLAPGTLGVSNRVRERALLLAEGYRRYLLKWATVRSHASFAAAASNRGVVSLLKPCCVPG